MENKIEKSMIKNKEEHINEFSKHNLTLADWFVLSHLASYGSLDKKSVPAFASWDSEQDFRGEVSQDECEKAFEHLISKELIQVVTEEFLSTINSNPIYEKPKIGEIDLTKKGASIFNSLSDKLYGENWFSCAEVIHADNQLSYFSKEEKEADFFIKEKLNENPNLSIKKRKIKKWCIYWWKEFEVGFQVTIGREKHWDYNR